VFEVVNVLLQEFGVGTSDTVLQIRQCLWTHQGKYWKGLVDQVADDDLSYGKAVFLLEVAQALEAIAVFLVIEENSVISMGVYIGQSTPIYDRATDTVSYGRVPAGSVVVSGSLPAPDGSHSLNCAVIVKRVDAQTRAKTSINELLRA